MASPRRRVLHLLPPLLTFLLWMALVTWLPHGWSHDDTGATLIAAAPPVLINLSLVLILFAEWKSGTRIGRRDGRGQAELEVIPLDRWKPPGLVRRSRRGRVVVVPKRHIRRVTRLTFSHQKRRALGLKELPPGHLNRRRPAYWQRRITW
jgi:hypothetical protein